MTTVEVSAWDDLEADAVASSGEKDRIMHLLTENANGQDVFRADAWLWEDKSFNTLTTSETLVTARVVTTTEKAWLITQNDAVDNPSADHDATDWVPKSVARRYTAASGEVDTDGQPQAFLGDYAHE